MKIRISIIVALLSISIGNSYAQVKTHFLKKEKSIRSKWGSNLMIKDIKYMPTFDMSKLKKEDTENDKKPGPFRFGKAFDVAYSLADGTWENVDGGRLWSITFASDGALSLNYVFNDLYLPQGAELYIENKDRNVIYGPVTSKNMTSNGLFLTDIIPGDQSTICIFEPYECEGMSKLIIKRIVHGYRGDITSNMNKATNSISPSISEYASFKLESDAVGYVIPSEADVYCTGFLLMSTDLSFRPFFMTTYYLVDANQNGTISQTEINNVENGVFIFRKTLPTNNETLDDILSENGSYQHSTFRAAWEDTSFALLELGNNVRYNKDLSWLGWTKISSAPTSATIIHFCNYLPDMRISFDYNQLSTDYQVTNGKGWASFLDVGTTSALSRGAPLLDQDRAVAGNLIMSTQHSGGAIRDIAGKFNLSWTGGGTNSTRLSNWLDPNGTNMTAISTSRPIGNVNLIGNDVINSSSTYYVDSLPSKYTVSWSLSDSYYNQNCLFENNPSANECTITTSNNHSMMEATLTASIMSGLTLVQTLSKTVYANVFAGTYYNGVTTKQVNLPNPLYVKKNANISLNSQNLVGATLTHEGSATMTQFSHNSSSGTLNLYFTSLGTRVVHVTCTNGLQYHLPFIVTDNVNQLNVAIGDGQIEVSLVPVEDEEMRNLGSSVLVNDLTKGETQTWTLEVYNATTGEKVFSQEVDGTNYIIDTTGWKPGVYVVRAVIGDEVLNEKVVVN